MTIWVCQRLGVWIGLVFLAFMLSFSHAHARGKDANMEVYPEYRTAKQGVIFASEYSFFPPSPVLRPEIPYFPGSVSEQENILYEAIHELPLRDIQATREEFQGVEEDGIPLLAETVVEGRTPGRVHKEEQKPVVPTVLAQTPDDSMPEEDFVDPFDDVDGAQPSPESRDPWESFNSTMFNFNYKMDRYIIKPVAKGYNFFIPPDMQNSFGNAFSNMAFAPRFLNDLFQGKFGRAGTETQRFLINTTIGVGGFFDVAKYVFDIEAPAVEDVGQTLAVNGVDSGPYLVLPFLPPSTVRDAIGFVGDTFLNPLNYFIPFIPNLGLNAGQRINERSINLETFEGLEESTVDLYGAVRSAYFERRSKQIRE